MNLINLAAFLLLFPAVSQAGIRPVPVDVVMAEGELFFVLEEPKAIQGVSVTIHISTEEVIARMRNKNSGRDLAMWAAESTVKQGKKRPKYPKLAQIRYAHKNPDLATTAGPVELQRNIKYKVHIRISGREFASEIFFIDDEGKAIVPAPSRQSGRAYSVSKDKDGNKFLVPAKRE